MAKNKLKKAVKRAAKSGDISRKEMKRIMKIAPTAAKAINKISKSGATLRASASNYAVQQARANPIIPRKPNKPVLGTSKLGKTLGSMAGVPGYKPTSSAQSLFIKGQRLDSKGRVVTGRPQKVITSDGSDVTDVETTPTGLSADDVRVILDEYLNTYGFGAQEEPYDPMMDYLSQMGEMFSSQMGGFQQSLSDQMALMNQFAAPQEIDRFFGAGQNYYTDAVRAAQRNRQRRTGYLRGGMGIGGQSGVTAGAPTSGLSIGPALGVLGGVTG